MLIPYKWGGRFNRKKYYYLNDSFASSDNSSFKLIYHRQINESLTKLRIAFAVCLKSYVYILVNGCMYIIRITNFKIIHLTYY